MPRRAQGRDWRLAAPVAILWQAERPLAVLAGGVVTLARAAPQSVREALVGRAHHAGIKVIARGEPELWSLMPSSSSEGSSRSG